MLMTPETMVSVIDVKAVLQAAARAAFPGVTGCPLRNGTRQVGTVFETSDAVYCYLEQIVPRDIGASPGEQTLDIFLQIEEGVRLAGMNFSNVIRTWFFLNKILDWYDEFNQARTPFLEARGRFEHLVPASTGVGMRNLFGAAGVAGALAVTPKRDGVGIFEVASPMQCPALDYRSSFSRAVEIDRDGHRELYVSGTASIEPGGQTVYLEDVHRQIGLSMDVVAAILESRNMTWHDCTRAIAYNTDKNNSSNFREYLRERGLERLPVTLMHADICRSDLLFEIELEAACERRPA